MLAGTLLTEHNLTFYGRLVARARQAILENDYSSWSSQTLSKLGTDKSEEDPVGA
jgi:tRNA-guanine family transglycosylase